MLQQYRDKIYKNFGGKLVYIYEKQNEVRNPTLFGMVIEQNKQERNR